MSSHHDVQFFKKDKDIESYFHELEQLKQYGTQYIPCVVCGCANSSELLTKYTMRVVSCDDCGHVFVNPQFTAEAVKKLYDSSYWDVLQPGVGNEKLSDRTAFDYQNSVAKLRRDILQFKTRGRFLDIGCSNGTLVKRAEEAGFEAIGLEVSEDVARFARESFPGIDVRSGLLHEQNYASGSFEVITMYDVVEHLFDPRVEFREIFRILKPGGLFFLETPTTDSIFFLEDPMKWDSMSPIEHVHLFSEANLVRLLGEIGFVVLESKCPHEDNITVHCTKCEG